uniref:QLQ domain-containing protein n=1 Tax=Caenorhabditis tropicalis TaxID=1561998 RepID=A0A1I7TBR8_9PELO
MPRGIPKIPRKKPQTPKQVWGKFPVEEHQGAVLNEEAMARIFKAPMNVIRYLQNKVTSLTEERARVAKINEQLITEVRSAKLVAAASPPPDHQQLLEMNRALIAENQRLSTQVYMANQLATEKVNDFNVLSQGSELQMQENLKLKLALQQQAQAIRRLQNRRNSGSGPSEEENLVVLE